LLGLKRKGITGRDGGGWGSRRKAPLAGLLVLRRGDCYKRSLGSTLDGVNLKGEKEKNILAGTRICSRKTEENRTTREGRALQKLSTAA